MLHFARVTRCHITLHPQVPDISVGDAQKNLKKSLEKGILKILSKMGISLLGCYHGAQIFEAYGLSREVRAHNVFGSCCFVQQEMIACSLCWLVGELLLAMLGQWV